MLEAKECYHHRLEENLWGPPPAVTKRNKTVEADVFFFPLEIVGHLPLNEFTIYSEVVLNLTSQ